MFGFQDDELKDVIKKILEGANLEEVTMKTLCKQVHIKYLTSYYSIF